MNNDYVDINIILDRSGSMASIVDDTIGGYNSYIESQKKLPGKALVTLVQFDHDYEVVHAGKSVQYVKPLDAKTYVPRGTTALLDAIGRTIQDIGKRLSTLPENERPGKVMVVIITDGYENASKDFDRKKVFDMISHQKDKYSWDFSFIGANQDAIQTGTSIGISGHKAFTYAANSVGTASAFTSASNYSSLLRSRTMVGVSTEDVGYTDEDRKTQTDAGAA